MEEREFRIMTGRSGREAFDQAMIDEIRNMMREEIEKIKNMPKCKKRQLPWNKQ